ncbi:hypothetical protein ACFC1B_07305 [Streptomyces xiamenensis]|uniref:hypothetical protein n=1 Tax=Streptomyces xiamenensis TaxID=408015 RepID=UPI0035D87C31
MSREVRRVPLDFNWPIKKVWKGYLLPDTLQETPCPDCESGYSPHAQNLYELWYGNVPFDPTSTGSTPWQYDTPSIWSLAKHNVTEAQDHHGVGDTAVTREAQRLADHFNAGWIHHLSQDDVDALLAAGRLRDLTHTWSADSGMKQIDPPVVPSAQQVNEWSLSGFGHDAVNAHVVIEARCAREGVESRCLRCGGHATLEAYPGQRTDAENWEPIHPPKGEGWQLWETVSEGSPFSPVFPSADDLAAWMSAPERGRHWVPAETARTFIDKGWSPTAITTPERGTIGGVEAMGWNPPESSNEPAGDA